jgi:adenylate cyclase
VLDYHNEQTFPNLMEVINYFKEGIGHYRNQRWDKAIASFEEGMGLNPRDKLSRIYIERCQYLMKNPPPDDWQGVWVMKSK